MMTRKPLLWSACASALLLTSACGKDEPQPSACGEPLYGGSATDEAWMTMVDALQKSADASKAVTLVSPSEAQTFAADATPPRFSWTSPLASAVELNAPSRYAQAHPRRAPGPLAWLGELLVPTAHAHLPPVTGDIHLVQVTVPGRECPIEVLTTDLEWQVDAASWQAMGEAAGQDLTVQVTSAYLKDNRMTEGPFRLATPRTFRRAAAP